MQNGNTRNTELVSAIDRATLRDRILPTFADQPDADEPRARFARARDPEAFERELLNPQSELLMRRELSIRESLTLPHVLKYRYARSSRGQSVLDTTSLGGRM